MSDHEDRLFDLVESLEAAVRRGDAIDQGLYAERYEVEASDVDDCVRALAALDLSLGEDEELGLPELPQPHFPDNYQVGREIGRGGMGVVYEAVEESLGRRVALKVLRPGDLHFGDAIRRFRGEARALARLRHPHIVSVHSVGETEEGLVFYAMDLVDGDTLAEEIAEADGLTPTQSLRLMRQITAAVTHAHAQGIIHRDLKPQNVLIDAQGDAFVCDFGLAQDALVDGVGLTRTGNLLGTPAYMSPEQASGKTREVGEATDVWALGALLYECLTGKGPFSNRPLHETIRAILHDDPTPPRRVDRRIPQALESITLKALRKDPEQRYATAEAFGEDLQRFADGREVKAQPLTLTDRARSYARRNRRPLQAAALAIVLFGVLAGLFLVPEIRQATRMADAEEFLDAGYAGAAVQTMRGRDDTEESVLLLLRALNDRAGELYEQGRITDMAPLAREGYELRERWQLGGSPKNFLRFRSVGRQEPADWEAFRNEMILIASGDRELIDPTFYQFPRDLLERWIGDLTNERAGPRGAARAVLSVELLAMIRYLPRADQRDAILAWHRRAAMEVRRGRRVTDGVWSPWSVTAIDSLWTPKLEDTLAAIALDQTEDSLFRFFCYRSWGILTGMPFSARQATDDSSVAELLATADDWITRWRSWQSLDRDVALRQRIEWLGSLDRSIGGAPIETSVEFCLALWLGIRPGTVGLDKKYRRFVASSSAEDWCLDRLGIQSAPSPSECLRNATADVTAESILWRHLAWLRVPDGVRVSEGNQGYGIQGPFGRTSLSIAPWYAVFGRPPRDEVVASCALLAFVDGQATPICIDSHRTRLVAGETLNIRLRDVGRTPPRPQVSYGYIQDPRRVRDNAEVDDLEPHEQVWYGVSGRAQLVIGPEGLEFGIGTGGYGGGGGTRSLFREFDLSQDGRVWAPGHARAIHWSCMDWHADGRVREYLTVIRYDEPGNEPPIDDVEVWRLSIIAQLQSATGDRIRQGDTLTPRYWALPEAREALERIHAYAAGRHRSDYWEMQAAPTIGLLSGADMDLEQPVRSLRDRDLPIELSRLAMYGPTREARDYARAELAALLKRTANETDDFKRATLPHRFADGLRSRAQADGVVLAPPIEEALRIAEGERHSGWLEERVLKWIGRVAGLLLLLGLSFRSGWIARGAAGGAYFLALTLLHDKLTVGHLVIGHATVFALCAAIAALRTTTGRRWAGIRRLVAGVCLFLAVIGLGDWTGWFAIPEILFPFETYPIIGFLLLIPVFAELGSGIRKLRRPRAA